MSQKTTGWLVVTREHKHTNDSRSTWSALHPQSGFTGWGATRAKAKEAVRTYLLQAQVSPDTLGPGKAERLYDE